MKITQQIKKLFGIKRKYKKQEQTRKEKVCVPVYLKNPNPLLEWETENSIELLGFLKTKTGKLLIELFRVNQVKKMMAATNDGNVFKCGEARGYGEAIDVFEQLSEYRKKNTSDELSDFRVRGSWSSSSNVVINETPNTNNV